MDLIRDEEAAALAAVERRLHEDAPDVAAEEIHRLVRVAHAGFADAPVRQFVPLLVHRTVRRQLEDRPS